MEIFEKNRIQYKDFSWNYLVSQNIDILYYGENKILAENSIQIAETEFKRISELFGFIPYHKIKLLVYNSPIDLLQSNIGLEEENSNLGLKNIFNKYTVEVSFKGSYAAYKIDIAKGISEILLKDMLYGGSVKEILQNSYLLTLPDWFTAGLMKYTSQGWNEEAKSFVSEYFLNTKVKNPASFHEDEAALIGLSIWHYIALKYGKSNISNILNLTRIIRNEQNSISGTIGLPYSRFIKDWHNYYFSISSKTRNTFTSIENQNIIFENKRNKEISKLKVNRDESMLAFSEFYKGRYKIYVYNRLKNRKYLIKTGGLKSISQKYKTEYPILAWNNNKLYMVYYSKGYPKLMVSDFDTKTKFYINLDEFQNIQNMDVSYDGKYLVFSAIKLGQSDIFLLNLKNNKFSRLTKDIFDDLNPSFSNTTNEVVFASNRLNDTLLPLNSEPIPQKINDKATDIFKISINFSKPNLTRLTKTDYDENNPILYNNSLYYNSNASGIWNISKQDSNGRIESSNFRQNCLGFVLADSGKKIISLSNIKQKSIIYESNISSLDLIGFNSYEDENIINENTKFSHKVEFKSKNNLDSNEIDIANYIFEEEKTKKNQAPPELTKRISKAVTKVNKEATFKGPFGLENRIGIKRAKTNLIIDPLRSWGPVFSYGIFDRLENHKFSGDFTLFMNQSRNNKLIAKYEYLRYRLDFRISIERNSIFKEPIDNRGLPPDNYIINRVNIGISYPLSNYFSLHFSPFGASTRFTQTGRLPGLAAQDKIDYYGGFHAEAKFDNTITPGLNLMEGIRFKIYFENFSRVDGISSKNTNQKSFYKYWLDFRAYKRVFKNIILAGKLSGGSFRGAGAKTFAVGGLDNWIQQRLNSTNNPKDPFGTTLPLENRSARTDWLFNTFVTGLRGFNLNSIYGQSCFLLNLETRIPIAKLFYQGPVNQSFIKNLQAVSFFDLGSAWSGKNPFVGDNTINTRIIENENFTAKVRYYRNPLLYGYGVGLRSVVLGYFVKFDMAWGVKNYTTAPASYYFSLGQDF